MRILNFGSCNIDCVYSVDRIVRPGETVAADDLKLYAGGKGLNQSIALSRAKVSVFHAGCIGQDGEMLRELLLSCGVNTDYLITVGKKTGRAIIQVDGTGENSIVLYSGANFAVSRDYVDSVLSDFKSGDFLLLQNEISELAYIIDRAYEIGMKIMLNPSPFQKSLKELDLNKLTYLILNETEAAGFSGMSEPEEFIAWVRKKYPKLCVILTLGDKGSECICGDRRVYRPAFDVKAVDTTAAGDTFTGYFAAGLIGGKTIEKSLEYASAAAALAVTKNGAAPSIPELDAVERSLGYLIARSGDKTRQKTETVNKYFENHSKDASVAGLSVLLGYSESYTGRWLHNNLGMSFSELLIDARCKKTAHYLKTTDLPVSEIIGLAGYRNESFLRKAFLKKYGCTPFEYRKKERIKDDK